MIVDSSRSEARHCRKYCLVGAFPCIVFLAPLLVRALRSPRIESQTEEQWHFR